MENSTHLKYTFDLFESIRKKFNGAGVERGGFVRAGLKPQYLRRFKGLLPDDLEEGASFTVEASFSEEQLRFVHETLAELKGFITGTAHGPALADRIVEVYLAISPRYFTRAMLVSTEMALTAFVQQRPTHAPVLDAIFRVAGGEGFRDLIRIYGAGLLENALSQTPAPEIDLLAFTDLHTAYRKNGAGRVQLAKYEVWCPGQNIAQTYYEQCQQAAHKLVSEHHINLVPSKREEISAFPGELSVHLNRFVKQIIQPILEGIS